VTFFKGPEPLLEALRWFVVRPPLALDRRGLAPALALEPFVRRLLWLRERLALDFEALADRLLLVPEVFRFPELLVVPDFFAVPELFLVPELFREGDDLVGSAIAIPFFGFKALGVKVPLMGVRRVVRPGRSGAPRPATGLRSSGR
jgi:hypothetical protein